MSFFLGSILVHLSGALLTLAAGGNNRLAHRLGAVCSIAGACCGLFSVWHALSADRPTPFAVYWNSAGLPLTLSLDGLAAFFLLPVYFLVLVCSLYAVCYLEFPAKGYQAARHWFSFNILVISMALVVAAADGLTFMLTWELMAISSFLLIISDTRNEKVRRAGGLYLIATHLGAAFLFLLFFRAYHWTGSLDFASFESLQNLPQPVALLFFSLAFIGFGAKAGIFPLHGWLPDAHSAAPSHVSALMSGIMIKTSIYAFLRFILFLPALSFWCGLVVMFFGLGSALFGISMASMQTDIKRSLAYSTIENMGIILLGIGLWLYCGSTGNTIASQLALAGALLHVWNHAFFKSLLFLSAGSVLHATGTGEMSMQGGLMRRMPFTGTLMIVGAAAVSALPPLNGFISELLIYLSLIRAGQTAAGGQAILFMLCAVILAMIGGMVGLTMTRIIGIVFGGEPRSRTSEDAREAPAPMIAAMAMAAALCFVIGVFPQAVPAALSSPLHVLTPGSPTLNTILPLPFGPAWSLGALIISGSLAAVTAILFRINRSSGAPATWGCGFVKPGPRMAYTGGSYAQLVQDEIYCSCIRPVVRQDDANILFPVKTRFRAQMGDLVLDRWFSPLFMKAAEVATSFRRLQAGRMNIYLTYIFLTTVLLLCWNYLMI